MKKQCPFRLLKNPDLLREWNTWMDSNNIHQRLKISGNVNRAGIDMDARTFNQYSRLARQSLLFLQGFRVPFIFFVPRKRVTLQLRENTRASKEWYSTLLKINSKNTKTSIRSPFFITTKNLNISHIRHFVVRFFRDCTIRQFHHRVHSGAEAHSAKRAYLFTDNNFSRGFNSRRVSLKVELTFPEMHELCKNPRARENEWKKIRCIYIYIHSHYSGERLFSFENCTGNWIIRVPRNLRSKRNSPNELMRENNERVIMRRDNVFLNASFTSYTIPESEKNLIRF